MHKLLNLGALLFLCNCPSAFSSEVLITEDFLESVAKKGSPNLDQIESAFQSALIARGEENEKFAAELFGKGSYAETNERALIEFAPVFSPIKQIQMGVRKNMVSGFDTSATVTTDQRTASSPFIGKLKNATTTTLAFTVQMDLWKNLFGRMSRARIENVQLEVEKAKIEKEIQEKTFHISLRRLYWSLVANELSMNTSLELLKTAKQQANETAARFRNSVAEADEVARYNAQVASREGTITFLKYQRELYLTQLKNLLPELSASDLRLGSYDIEKTIYEVLSCTMQVSGREKTPYDFTKYDELVSMLTKIRQRSQMVNERYADVDVKLYGTVRSTGVSLKDTEPGKTPAYYRGNYGGTFDDMTNTNRTGYEVGVQFNMPLGDVKKNTQKSKELYDDKRLLAAIQSTTAKVENTHREFVKTIKLLNEVIGSQKVNSRELEKRLKGMQKKYQQARVSVNEMVLDQDALLQAQLTTIDTQLQILNTIFDYLVVFPDTPCEFNRI